MLIRVTRTDAEDSHWLSFSLRTPRILSDLGGQKLLTAEIAKNGTRVRGDKPDSQKLVVISPISVLSSEPPGPQPDHAGMGDGGGGHAAAFAPGAAVENSCDGGEQYITPVEVCRPFVEVREAEEHRGD